MTFVDNAHVSHSNLLRQCLFEFADIGLPKAEAAVRRITAIYPPATGKVKGVQLQIPMPDHAETSCDMEEKVGMLEQLVSSHDLTFLCTDNKESRWLPTLVAVNQNKPLINLAVGFDSWVVMRHPLTDPDTKYWSDNNWSRVSVENMGCYFCTSVEGVSNTTRDRQIDERCTVTRGGTASVAGAYAVELAVTLLTHPQGFHASGEICNNVASSCPLSTVCPPQQIRGSIRLFNTNQCISRRNPQCCACSTHVSVYYRDAIAKFKFLENVCRDSAILKTITALDQYEIASTRDNILEVADEAPRATD